MAYHEFLLATPYSYAAVAGIAIGCGVAGLIPGGRFRFRDRRKRAQRIARLYVALSAAIAAATAGILIVEPVEFLEIGVLYTLGAGVVIATGAVRFPRSIGAVVVVGAALIGGCMASLATAWHPVQAEQSEGRFRVLRSGGGTMAIEHIQAVNVFDEPGRIFTLSGAAFAVELEVVTFSEYLFFTGAEELYRLRAVYADALDDAEGAIEQSQPFPRPQLIVAAWLTDRLRAHTERLPGIELRSLRTNWVEPRPLEHYSLEVEGDAAQLLWNKTLREEALLDDRGSSDDDHALSGR